MASGGKGWLVPLVVGVAAGWLLSTTISRTVAPLHLPVHPFAYGDE